MFNIHPLARLWKNKTLFYLVDQSVIFNHFYALYSYKSVAMCFGPYSMSRIKNYLQQHYTMDIPNIHLTGERSSYLRLDVISESKYSLNMQ